jgi:hypothetical protein
MIRFTITSGKLVLDPNIVLFKDLQDLFNCADGPKFLQVIYYTHSTEPDNPFTGLDARVLEENIFGRCLTKALEELKVPKATEDKFKLQTFPDVQQYS